jgi:predicted nucleic acid-binding protein
MTENPLPRLYIDTNVFIQVFEKQDTQLTDLFAGEPIEGTPFLFTSALARAELLVKPIRDGDDELRDIYRNWTVSNPVLEVGPIDDDVLEFAAVLRAQYSSLRLPDAIHVSTAIGFGCTHFVSYDKKLGTISRFIEPSHPDFVTIVAPYVQ